eukprot:3238025-Amphidinium_carterae.1
MATMVLMQDRLPAAAHSCCPSLTCIQNCAVGCHLTCAGSRRTGDGTLQGKHAWSRSREEGSFKLA